MKYYNVHDIQKITGTSYSKSCEIIRNLNNKFKENHPNAEIVRGKILKEYFNDVQGISESDENDNQPVENYI